ncbi:High-affinity nitrate transporter 3.1, partial [Mucuna pruriens]
MDKITVAWTLNNTVPTGTDSTYKTIKVKLCYAPVSQRDRAWRKTEDDLSRDKTCQPKIVADPAMLPTEQCRDSNVPTATFFVRAYAYHSSDVEVSYGQTTDAKKTIFVRAYAYHSSDVEVSYGQTTDAKKTTNLFQIHSISGRHASLDVSSVCFSAFSVLSLIVFFFIEKRMGKASSLQNK